MPGTREMEPPEGTPSCALEDEAIAAVGATREDFARAGRDLPGARRPVLLTFADPPLFGGVSAAPPTTHRPAALHASRG